MQVASTILGCREPYERRIARPLAEELREEKPVRLFFAGQSEAALGRETDHCVRTPGEAKNTSFRRVGPRAAPLNSRSLLARHGET